MSGLLRRFALVALALVAFNLSGARAQDYPSRPISLIVPLAAGSGMDVIARMYGEKLAQSLGKPVVVENRPGANMATAAQATIAAPHDGHTLTVASSSTFSVNPTLFKQLPYDPKDLAPISHYVNSVFILVVNPSLPIHSVPEFLKYAREQTTPMTYSSPAGGGAPHFTVEMMRVRFDLKLTHVPYRSSPQSIQDIAAGHVNFAFVEAGASLGLIREGKLRPLAVSSKQRLPALPDVPPFADVSGASDFELVAWHMLAAPAKTPRPIVQRLSTEMQRIMADQAIKKRLSDMGLLPLDPVGLRETERFVESENVKWSTLLKAIGLEGTQ
jgi:tripartite-type tricarboxylate transporter receptor subunit TctC